MKRSLLDELVTAERAQPAEPSNRDARDGWLRLERDLAIGATAPFDLPPSAVAPARPGLLASASAKFVIGTALLGGVVATSIYAGRDGDADHERATAVVDTSARPTPTPIVVPPPQPEPAAVPSPAPAPASRAIDPPPAPRPAPRARTKPRAAKPAAPGIAAEVMLIDRARRAVAAADFATALSVLDDHSKRFPRGALLEDRAALRVLALCRSGRTRDGATERGRFLDRWPESVHAETVSLACE